MKHTASPQELAAHRACAETCNCCTTWNVRLGFPCTCPGWVDAEPDALIDPVGADLFDLRVSKRHPFPTFLGIDYVPARSDDRETFRCGACGHAENMHAGGEECQGCDCTWFDTIKQWTKPRA